MDEVDRLARDMRVIIGEALKMLIEIGLSKSTPLNFGDKRWKNSDHD